MDLVDEILKIKMNIFLESINISDKERVAVGKIEIKVEVTN